MPKGQLYIRTSKDGQFVDAYDVYGMSLDQSALSTLMTPVANKEYIKNSSRLEDGSRVVKPSMPKKEERTFTITFNITAKDENEFMSRYAKICDEILAVGYIELKTSFQKNVVYKTYYQSCTQFSQFRQSIGKFSIKLNEPNPSDRG